MKNPINPTLKTEIIPLIVLAITVIAAYFFYNNLPTTIPIHWNIAGEADRWGSVKGSVLGFGALVIGIYLLMLFLPMLDPKKQRYLQFAKTYHIFKALLVLMFFSIYLVSHLAALGVPVAIDKVIPLFIGIMFMVMGNYMAKLKKNWFIGIRTPWTLSSEEIWNKTHRVGGKIFILSGALFIIQGWLPIVFRPVVLVLTIALMLFGTIGYSYYIYHKQVKNK